MRNKMLSNGMENMKSNMKEKEMVNEKRYAGANIWFPWARFDKGEKVKIEHLDFHRTTKMVYPITTFDDEDVWYPIHIHTTKERLENFFEYIEEYNGNLWTCEEYESLKEEITKYAAKIVLESESYFEQFKEIFVNSPYEQEHRYEYYAILKALHEQNDEEAVECMAYLLERAGGYRIEFWEDMEEQPRAFVKVIEDEDCDLLVEPSEYVVSATDRLRAWTEVMETRIAVQ